MNLTAAQREAIQYRGGHVQLLACAGSGKTEVVARRIATLLDPRGPEPLAPHNIVAFTFTDRAAAELKARIVRRVREAYGSLRGMSEMFVGTIHAFCIRLLQDEVPDFLRYGVLDESRQLMLVQREPVRSGFDAARTLDGSALALGSDVRGFLTALDVLRQAELDRARLGALPIVDALDRYRALLREASYFDYTAQLELAVDVLRRNIDAGQRLAARVRHVVVDEYQDTNSLQEQVVRALAEYGATLTVVGDDDQTIFQWNGADVENILTFSERYPGARQIRLEDNFRSSAPIVTFARDFVADITRRLPKVMQPTDAQSYEHGDLLALSFGSEWDEARFIGRKVRELHGLAFTEGAITRGITWSDICILLRSGLRWSAGAITRVLDELGVPYAITGVKTLFECAEVRAACALFGFLAGDPAFTDGAVRTAWLDAKLGVEAVALDRTIAWLHERRESLTVPAGVDRSAWRPLSLQRLLHEALDLLGIREERVPDGEGESVFYNLGRFSSILGDLESIHAGSPPADRVVAFHRYASDSARGEHEEGLQKAEHVTRDAVRITTVHRAKGLQWPVVFLPGLGDDRFPLKGREPALWTLVPREVVRSPQRYESNPDDERRLFYVAVTRAQKFLFASWSRGRYGKPSTPGAYFEAFVRAQGVVTTEVSLSRRPRAEAVPRAGVTDLRLTFSQIKPLLECGQRYRLQSVYGFQAPLEEAQGFGTSLHNALAEVHRRALDGDTVTTEDVPRLLDRHLHLPYASPETRERLDRAASAILSRYLIQHGARLAEVELVEKSIEVQMGDGVTVEGRIDLVTRRGRDDVAIVDLKSTHRAQAEALTDVQLRLYALGYEELTGQRPHRTEVWELDTLQERTSPVDDAAVTAVRAMVTEAARRMRTGDLPPDPEASRCAACAVRGVCSARVDPLVEGNLATSRASPGPSG